LVSTFYKVDFSQHFLLLTK